MRIFLNETPIEVPTGSSIADALRAANPSMADELAAGGYFTDGVGRRIDPDSPVSEGMIVRAVVSAREDQPEE